MAASITRSRNAELPRAVAAALANPAPGVDRTVSAAGYDWFVRSWGSNADAPLLLIHGVTSDADAFWRLGPALVAAGRHVLAIDLPGHGRTGGWLGRHRFAETAADVVELVRALDLAGRPDLAVLGHSWGGMVAAALPAAGLAPRTLILLDPPCLPLRYLALMTKDPEEQPTADLDEAVARFRAAHPGWLDGDVRAKAVGVTRFDVGAVGSILLDNGDWDAGIAALADPAAEASDVWLIRGDPKAGCLVPDAAIPAIEQRLGTDHVVTISGAPHSPQRTHIEPLVAAILAAIAP
ncbi:MAG TPA: alpha/beta fold hydrolase [Candidatus Limnocylindrales bacterium]|nr:alpha/beta fold hydrolase [Candidatus Limnocylindrales bacterium]